MDKETQNKGKEVDAERNKEALQNAEPRRKSSWQAILIAVAMFACCGFPLLIVAASSLAVYSLFNWKNIVIIIVTIIVLAFALYGFRIRRKHTNEKLQQNKIDGCCT